MKRVAALLFLVGFSAALVAQQTPADKYAWDLNLAYIRNGYDIRVNYFEHELTLKSDLFQDSEFGRSLLNALYEKRQTLCAIDIWYLSAGHSKGWLSPDIMKRVSLGCPAAKAARIEATKGAREELAKELANPATGLRVYVDGTTLVFDNDTFDDPTYRSKFVHMILAQKSKQVLCDKEFSNMQFKGNKQVKTVAIGCR